MKSPKQATGNQAAARQYNSLRADAAGGGNLLAHNMLGILKIPTNATNGQTITLTINGSVVTITMVSGTPTNANDVKIGASGTATAANIGAFCQNPGLTNTNQVAATAGNQQLLSYLGFTVKDANLSFFNLNNDVEQLLTALTVSTTITSGTYEASTLKLYIEPGTFYVGTTQVAFSGSPTGTFTAPAANPRIDLLCVGTSSAISIVAGSESASPVAPTYPTDKVVLCEIYNRVGQTEVRDNDNTSASQGYILKDARPFTTIMYINDANQIQDGVITSAKLTLAGTVPTGTVTPYAGPTGTTIAGWLECTGTAVSRTTYAALFGVIGTTYGVGNGSTTFNLPDLRSRIPLGVGAGVGPTGTAVGTGTPTGTPLTTRVLGQWGGEETHLLVASEAGVGSHAHSQSGAGGGAGAGSNVASANSTGSTSTTGGASADASGAHANLQPFLVLNFIIKT